MMSVYEKLNVARQVAQALKEMRRIADNEGCEIGGWIVVELDGSVRFSGKATKGSADSVYIPDSYKELKQQPHIKYVGQWHIHQCSLKKDIIRSHKPSKEDIYIATDCCPTKYDFFFVVAPYTKELFANAQKARDDHPGEWSRFLYETRETHTAPNRSNDFHYPPPHAEAFVIHSLSKQSGAAAPDHSDYFI